MTINVLITGTTGFIGKKFLNSINNDRYNISLLSRKKISDYKTFICDLGENDIPSEAFNNIDIVFHLAGYAHDIKNKKNESYLNEKINFEASINIINKSIVSGVKKFVYISSTKAQDVEINDQIKDQKKHMQITNFYGRSKKKVEDYLCEKCSSITMKYLIIRPALVYGPGVKGNLRTLVNIFKMFWFPPLPKTGNCKSMVHVDDLIDSINFLVNNKCCENDIFTITDGECYSARDIYEILSTVFNRRILKISIPMYLFNLMGFIIPGLSEKINKMFASEFYSSKKIEELGFIAQKKLIDINNSKY